ncbi:hypothetical protein [Alkalibacillus silvisoli]|uniref:Uncharacterized protein n=1 Tax=Alkalibacillus silvisoli TaxID=392823 RepID=A0ABN0ZNB4_9BACI
MKKFILIVILLLMAACTTETDQIADQYPELLPDEGYQYGLLTVGEDITFEELRDRGIGSINTINYVSSLERADERYPLLELENDPELVLLDENGLVTRVNSLEELIEELDGEGE